MSVIKTNCHLLSIQISACPGTGEFLAAYIDAIQPAGLLPSTTEAINDLLELFLLEKSLLEIDAELTARPDWMEIPLRGAVRLLGYDPADPELRL